MCSLGFQIMNLARPPESRESPTLTFSLVRHWPKNIPRCSPGHEKFQIAVCLKTVKISILLRSLTHPDVLAAPFKTLVKADFSCFHLRRKHFKSPLGKGLGRKGVFCKCQNVRDSRATGYLWEDISRPSSHVSLKNSYTLSSGDVTYP